MEVDFGNQNQYQQIPKEIDKAIAQVSLISGFLCIIVGRMCNRYHQSIFLCHSFRMQKASHCSLRFSVLSVGMKLR